jgi:hypothetical protein
MCRRLGGHCKSRTLRVTSSKIENRRLRRIFGPMSDELTGMLRKLHNEKLGDLYF